MWPTRARGLSQSLLNDGFAFFVPLRVVVSVRSNTFLLLRCPATYSEEIRISDDNMLQFHHDPKWGASFYRRRRGCTADKLEEGAHSRFIQYVVATLESQRGRCAMQMPCLTTHCIQYIAAASLGWKSRLHLRLRHAGSPCLSWQPRWPVTLRLPSDRPWDIGHMPKVP